MLQLPPAAAVALPIKVAPSNSVTVLPASADPVKVGVVTLVIPSVLDDPESDAEFKARGGRGYRRDWYRRNRTAR